MISFTANQQRVVDAEAKVVSWLLDVYLDGSSTPDYRWSHKSVTYDGNSYEFRVIPEKFSGIKLNRCNKESKIYSPTTCEFSIANPYNYYDDRIFTDSKIIIKLVAEDDTGEELLLQWAFICRYPERRQQTIFFKCTDFVTRYLNGFYPKTPLYKDVFPSKDPDPGGIDDNMCIPVPIGTAYVPIRSVYIDSDARYYVLGPSDEKTYTIDQVRSPRSTGTGAAYWDSSDYEFQQSIKTGRDGVKYTVFKPSFTGFWADGEIYEDIPTKFSRDDTVSMTNPADVIEFFLLDIGIPSDMIDSTSFTSAASTYNTWGLSFSGAFFFRQDRATALSNLLTQCNSVLDCEEKIKLRVLDKSTVITITEDDIQRKEDGSTTFTRSNIANVSEDDSGYIAFQSSTEPIDKLQKYAVAADTTAPTTDSPAGDVIKLWFVHDSQDAQRVGKLHYARKLGRMSESSFVGMSNTLGVQPDDTYKVLGSDYHGSSYFASLVQIMMDLSIKIRGYSTRFDIVNWEDVSPSSITAAEDTTTSAYRSSVTGSDTGTSSGGEQNVNIGKSKFGSGANQIITEGSDTEARLYGGMTGYKTGIGFYFGYNSALGEWEISFGQTGVEGIYWSPTDGLNQWGSAFGGGSQFAQIEIVDTYTAGFFKENYSTPGSWISLDVEPPESGDREAGYDYLLNLGTASSKFSKIVLYTTEFINNVIGDGGASEYFKVTCDDSTDQMILYKNYSGVANSWTVFSDRRLKKKIKALSDNSLGKILQLNPSSFTKDGEKRVGFVADEVAPALKDSVETLESDELKGGVKGVRYDEIFTHNVKAVQLIASDFGARIQDLESAVNRLDKENKALKEELRAIGGISMINPTGGKVRNDSAGQGHYLAPRGSRRHHGVDFECTPGQDVASPIDGTVIRIAYPYDDKTYEGLYIQSNKIAIKMFYLKPKDGIIGKKVKTGDVIGEAQDISKLYSSGMKPHIHLEIDHCCPMLFINLP